MLLKKLKLDLINDIIDISKIEANKIELFFEEINLNSLLLEVNDSLIIKAKKKNINLFLNLKKIYIL
jgi:signal transduction histidine kinase